MYIAKFDRLLFDYLNKKAGLTSEDVATALGITRQTLTTRMAGKTSFSVDEAVRWCNLVGASDLKGVFYTEAEHDAG